MPEPRTFLQKHCRGLDLGQEPGTEEGTIHEREVHCQNSDLLHHQDPARARIQSHLSNDGGLRGEHDQQFAIVPSTHVLALPGLIGIPTRLSQMVLRPESTLLSCRMEVPEGLLYCCGQNPLTPGFQNLLMSPLHLSNPEP